MLKCTIRKMLKMRCFCVRNKANITAAALYVYWLFMPSAIMIWHKRLFNL